MPTRNTRAKRVARKNVKNLLVDEMAFKTNVARNLNLLAGDILSDEEYAIISDNSNPDIKLKFKLLEFFTNSGLLTAKN